MAFDSSRAAKDSKMNGIQTLGPIRIRRCSPLFLLCEPAPDTILWRHPFHLYTHTHARTLAHSHTHTLTHSHSHTHTYTHSPVPYFLPTNCMYRIRNLFLCLREYRSYWDNSYRTCIMSDRGRISLSFFFYNPQSIPLRECQFADKFSSVSTNLKIGI